MCLRSFPGETLGQARQPPPVPQGPGSANSRHRGRRWHWTKPATSGPLLQPIQGTGAGAGAGASAPRGGTITVSTRWVTACTAERRRCRCAAAMLTVSVTGRQMRGHHSVNKVGHSLRSRTQQRIRHHRPQPVMLRFQSVPKMCRRRSMCRRICKPALLAGKSPCVVLCAIQHTYMVPFIMEAVAAEDGCSVWLRCHLLAGHGQLR